MANGSTAQRRRIAFPMATVRLAIAAMILMLLAATYLTAQVGRDLRDAVRSQIDVLVAAERLQQYGNLLELSVRTVVTYGDRGAAGQYRTVQPQLRQTLSELRDNIQLTDNQFAAQRVDRADLALVAMEQQALELAREGKLVEAREIINSARYDQLVDVYQNGIGEIERRAEAYVESIDDELDFYLYADLALTAAAFALIIVGWVALVRPARRWGSELSEAREHAERAARQLEEKQAELEILNRKLFEQARIDHLTKLQTRRKLHEDVAQLWPRVERYGESYCAAICDIDNFKRYNDTHGHLAGDEVLKSVAHALSASRRGGDKVYRFGGEEFVIVMPNCTKDECVTGAERYRAAVEALQIPHPGSESGSVTMSIGVSMLESTDGKTVESWLADADSALYEAKRLGRNRVVRSEIAAAA